jgi:hypothetical protein
MGQSSATAVVLPRAGLPVDFVSAPKHMGTRRHPVLEAMGIIVLFGALVFVAPGALITFAFEHILRLNLDVEQRWTWAIAVSAVAACIMALRSRRGSDGVGRYMIFAVLASSVVLVARFGMHAHWAAEMLREYVP